MFLYHSKTFLFKFFETEENETTMLFRHGENGWWSRMHMKLTDLKPEIITNKKIVYE